MAPVAPASVKCPPSSPHTPIELRYWCRVRDLNRWQQRERDGKAGRDTPRVGFSGLQINIFLKILFNLLCSSFPPSFSPSLHLTAYSFCLFCNQVELLLTTIFKISRCAISLFFSMAHLVLFFALWRLFLSSHTPANLLHVRRYNRPWKSVHSQDGFSL